MSRLRVRDVAYDSESGVGLFAGTHSAQFLLVHRPLSGAEVQGPQRERFRGRFAEGAVWVDREWLRVPGSRAHQVWLP